MWLVNGFQSNEMSSIHKHLAIHTHSIRTNRAEYTTDSMEMYSKQRVPCTGTGHTRTHAHNRIHPFKYTISYTQCVWMNDENSKLTSKQATHLLSSNTRLFTSVEFSFSERQGLRKFSLDKLFPGYKRRWDDLIDKEKIKYSNKCSI